jgi:hypothetical protein
LLLSEHQVALNEVEHNILNLITLHLPVYNACFNIRTYSAYGRLDIFDVINTVMNKEDLAVPVTS